MSKLCLFVPVALLAVGACATNNGDTVHGQQFAPPDGSVTDDAPTPTPAAGGPPPAGDAGADGASSPDTSVPPDPCQAGTVVVLAGGDSALTGSAQIKGGPWTGAVVAGGAAKSAPAIVPFGSGFVALTRGAGDALLTTTFDASWSAASALGTETTVGAPALATVNGTAHAVYLAPGTPKRFYRAANAGTAWSITADPVISGTAQSFGASAGTVAAAGGELVFAQDGGDNDGLYTQTFEGAWSAGAPIFNAGTLTSSPPTLLAIDGKNDLVLLYADNTANHVIGFATRDANSKTWSPGAVTQGTAQTAEQPQIARISGTALVVTFRGNNQRPYTMTGAVSASGITWSVPAPLLADASTVDGPPSVATGVCGDDAIAVFASAGQVKATRYRNAAWSVPEAVGGTTGSRVFVATR